MLNIEKYIDIAFVVSLYIFVTFVDASRPEYTQGVFNGLRHMFRHKNLNLRQIDFTRVHMISNSSFTSEFANAELYLKQIMNSTEFAVV